CVSRPGVSFSAVGNRQVLHSYNVQCINGGNRIVFAQHGHDVPADHDKFRMRNQVALSARQLERKRTKPVAQFLPNAFCVHGVWIAGMTWLCNTVTAVTHLRNGNRTAPTPNRVPSLFTRAFEARRTLNFGVLTTPVLMRPARNPTPDC